MNQPINRRDFIAASAAVAAGLGLGVGSSAAQAPTGRRGGGGKAAQTPAAPTAPLTFKTKLHKALIVRPTEDELKRNASISFEERNRRLDLILAGT